jgi:hypothetical protein
MTIVPRLWRYASFSYRFNESWIHMPVGVMMGGTCFAKGLLQGWEDAEKTHHGYIWRPVLYAISGGGIGTVLGLYWLECGTILVCKDLYQSYCLDGRTT